MSKIAYKKYNKDDQKLLAIWAIDCAERVLPFFEKIYPSDSRPRIAIETCQRWVSTDEFKMSVIRKTSLDSHAAARDVIDNAAACFAARAAGQAVATAHITQHAYGAAYYALKAIAATDVANAENNVADEMEWQSQQLPESLRQEIMCRITVQKAKHGIVVKIRKDDGF